MATIVTAYSAQGFHEYGLQFLESYLKHDTADFELIVYVTDLGRHRDIYKPLTDAADFSGKKIVVRDQKNIPGYTDFEKQHKNDLAVKGALPVDGWNDREKKNGYSFKFDAYKFFRMVLVMWDAGCWLETGKMIWLDGDNVLRQDLPGDLVERSLIDGASYAYLGREPKHTETGYLVFDLPACLPILNLWAGYYLRDEFKGQKEWHSAFLFDRAREQRPDIKGHNLTPGGRGHVIHKCWVGNYFDHKKGKRKHMRRSPEAKPIQ